MNYPPGFYRDVPDTEYFAWDAVSNSKLSKLDRSPLHCKAANDNNPKTKDMILGTAIHYSILQPNIFKKKFGNERVFGKLDRRKPADKAKWMTLIGRYGEENILSEDDYNSCETIRNACLEHPACRLLLESLTDTELSCTWTDSLTGLRCKSRLDGICDSLSSVIDIKSTDNASLEAFSRKIFNFGYHRQGAFYLEALRVLGRPMRHYVIIAIEKTPPYAIAVYRLNEATLEAGEVQIRKLLPRYKECLESGVWPGYSEKIVDIDIPHWAFNKIEPSDYVGSFD